jgi:hypothetical protein
MSKWIDTGKEIEPDARKRISLGTAVEYPNGVRFRVMKNDQGQILLDPVVSVPASEAWFFKDHKRVEAFRRSVEQAEAGQVVKIDLDKLEREFE